MQIIARYTAVYGRKCVGCRREKRDIMLAIGDMNGTDVFHDVFLTQDQAAALVLQLQERIAENLAPEDPTDPEEEEE